MQPRRALVLSLLPIEESVVARKAAGSVPFGHGGPMPGAIQAHALRNSD